MKAYVISLKNSTRRKLASERAASANLEIKFIDAIDASSNLIFEKIRPTSEITFQKRYGRRQTDVELACLLSHHILYQALLKTNLDYCLILEDDFIPLVSADILDEVLSFTMQQNVDLMLLGYSKVDDMIEHAIGISNPLMNRLKIPNHNYVIGQRCRETTCGTVSYFVSPKFLKVMSTIDDFGRLADDWDFHKKLGLKIAHISPLCFREDYKNMYSSIEFARSRTNNRALRLPLVLRPLWRHILGNIRRINFYCLHIKKIYMS